MPVLRKIGRTARSKYIRSFLDVFSVLFTLGFSGLLFFAISVPENVLNNPRTVNSLLVYGAVPWFLTLFWATCRNPRLVPSFRRWWHKPLFALCFVIAVLGIRAVLHYILQVYIFHSMAGDFPLYGGFSSVVSQM